MMFKRTEEEEESGSDWDEMTPPRATPTSHHQQHQQLQQQQHPSNTSTQPTTSLANPAPFPTVSRALAIPSITEVPSESPAPSPRLKQEPAATLDHTSMPTLTLPTHGAKATSPRPLSLSSMRVSMSTGSPGRDSRTHRVMENTLAAGDTIRPFQDMDLTSIAAVKTPHPPPPKTPPTAKPVYMVEQGMGGGAEGGEEVGERLGSGHGRHGTDERRDREEEKHMADLQFTEVSGQKVDYLSLSTHPPYAYMTQVADQWEGFSQRMVQECCASIRLVTDFIIAVLLGSAHCLLHHGIRKLLCGLGHITADAFCKPLSVLCFNGVFWPLSAGLVQLSRAFVLFLGPLLEVVGVVMSWTVQVARACRLVVISNRTFQGQHFPPQQHV